MTHRFQNPNFFSNRRTTPFFWMKVAESISMIYSTNFGELYEQICRDLPMPESLVEKMIAFHLGQMALNVDDMSEMSAFMYHRFKRFAESLPGFRVRVLQFSLDFLVWQKKIKENTCLTLRMSHCFIAEFKCLRPRLSCQQQFFAILSGNRIYTIRMNSVHIL